MSLSLHRLRRDNDIVSRAASGFTLLELLITLTIFSLIVLSLYSTFASGISVWRRSEDANMIYQEARLVLDAMARDLTRAVVYDFSDTYPEIIAFDGTETEVAFLMATDSGLKRIRYGLTDPEQIQEHITIVNYQEELPSTITARYEESEASTLALTRNQLSFAESVTLGDNELLNPQVLTSLVEPGGLSFRYASIDTNDAGEMVVAWTTTWQDNSVVPQGIQISLKLSNPQRSEETVEFVKTVSLPTGRALSLE
ncbi:type II secretion system protein J [Candidatus Omnitrophota bacterium]